MFRIDMRLANERYQRLAGQYDYATRRIETIRPIAIDALHLQPGQRVLDVACGTGKSFQLLREAVGPTGEVVGVEQSPDMLAQAHERVVEAGWDNVQLIESSMEKTELQGSFDAVLFVYTQDVLQSDVALQRIFANTHSKTRVACTGLKLFPWYLGLANIWLLAISYPYFTTFKGLRKPWTSLQTYVEVEDLQPTFMGSGYIAHGTCR